MVRREGAEVKPGAHCTPSGDDDSEFMGSRLHLSQVCHRLERILEVLPQWPGSLLSSRSRLHSFIPKVKKLGRTKLSAAR